MAALQTPSQPTALPAWEQLFYDGDRLRAEVTLFADAVVGNLQFSDLSAGCAQIHRSHGAVIGPAIFECLCRLSVAQPEPTSHKEAWKQFLPVADLARCSALLGFTSTFASTSCSGAVSADSPAPEACNAPSSSAA